MNQTDLDLYGEVMARIKCRIVAINDVLRGKISTTYRRTDVEFVYLQFRLVFELVAMASLCSNRPQYQEIRSSFEKDWRLAKIVRTIKASNPNFYPKPFELVGPQNGIVTMTPLAKEYMTESELVKAHGRCGGWLHESNPYKKIEDWDDKYTMMQFEEWMSKLAALLENHRVQLFGTEELLIVTMNTAPDVPDGKVGVRLCETIDPPHFHDIGNEDP